MGCPDTNTTLRAARRSPNAPLGGRWLSLPGRCDKNRPMGTTGLDRVRPRPLTVIGAATSAGAYGPGQERAPEYLRAHGLVDALVRTSRPVRDAGNVANSFTGLTPNTRRPPTSSRSARLW